LRDLFIDGNNDGEDFQKRGSFIIENKIISPLPNTPKSYDENSSPWLFLNTAP